jgi:hypothetical protein
MMMDPDLAREIAELSRQHDELLARDQLPAGSLPVQREASLALLYRTTENNAPVPVPDNVGTPSTAATMSETESRPWNEWLDRRLESERELLAPVMGRVISEIRHEWRTEREAALVPLQREIADARAENVELRGLLTSCLSALDEVRKTAEGLERAREIERRERAIRDETIRERSARIADLQRDNAASHTELARQQRDRELAQRDQRIEQLEIKLGMLLTWIGQDLPRRFFERTE